MEKANPLKAGDSAPDFHFEEDGKALTLADLTEPCLLYFYPKDDTPGCTKEACAFRDAWSQFTSAGLRVIGASGDDLASHGKFTKKYGLPFPLIADTDLQVARAYGVYGEKKFMGKTYEGIHRMSFLIGSDGIILKSYPKVKPDRHAAEVLDDLAQLQN